MSRTIRCIALALLGFCIVSAPGASFPAADSIAGQWQGVFQCDGYTTRFSVDIRNRDTLNFAGTLERTILGPSLKKHTLPYEKNLAVNGQYDAQTGTLVFGSGQSRRQELKIQGIVGPSGERMTGTAQWSGGRRCSPVVMGKKFDGEIKKMLARAKPRAYRPKPDARAACDVKVTQWMSQPLGYEQYNYNMRDAGIYASLALFEDSRFTPYFGKSFAKMSKRELVRLENQIARPCWGELQAIGGDARTAQSALSILRQQQGTTVSVQIFPHASAIARSWQAHAVSIADPLNQQQVQQFTTTARLFTQVLWPESGFNFSTQLAGKKSAAGANRMTAALKTQLDNPAPTFEDLEQLAAFEQRFVVGSAGKMESPTRTTGRTRRERAARNRSQQAANIEQRTEFVVTSEAAATARQDIRAYINQHAVAAATRYASQMKSPQQAQTALLPVAQRPGSRMSAYLTPPNTTRVNQIFSEQQNNAAKGFAASEAQTYATRKQTATDDLAGLRQLNAYYVQLENKYGALLNLDAFARLRATAASDRQSILQLAQPALLAQLQQTDSVGAMESLLASAVIPLDQSSASFQPIANAVAAKRKSLAPFTGYPGADYLNAIYAGDTRKMTAIDGAYSTTLKNSLKELGGGGVFGGFYNRAIDQIRLIEPMMAVYLLNYEKSYARCLRADAAAFTVTRTVPTTVTTNLLGWEIARSEGYTINSTITVNREFQSTFRKVGTMRPNDFMATMVDQLMSNGGIGAVNQGVRQMMRDHDCDGAVIEQMEERMRAAFER